MTTIIYDMTSVLRDNLMPFADKLAPEIADKLIEVFNNTGDVIVALDAARDLASKEGMTRSLDEIDDFLKITPA